MDINGSSIQHENPTDTGILADSALGVLADAGAHLVLCRPNKRPIWPRWNKRRASGEVAEVHRRECGPVGIIPWSLRATGLDVDAGDPSDLFAEYRPWALLPTRRKGGQHAYFDDGEPRPNSTWAARGCSGDVRGGSGYLILHDDGPEILVEALARRVEGERPWPRDLFELVGLAPFRVRGPVEPVCLVDTAAALNRSALIELPLEQIQVGARHPALWDQCRFWAYRQSKGTSLVNWKARVFAYALRQNERFPRPFSQSEINDEVARLAWSIASWTWDGHGPIDHGPGSAIAARYRRRKGQALSLSTEGRRNCSSSRWRRESTDGGSGARRLSVDGPDGAGSSGSGASGSQRCMYGGGWT